MDDQIIRWVRKLRRWLTVTDLLGRMLWYLSAGLLAAVMCEGISCFVPWYSAHRWAAAAVVLAVLACVIHSFIARPTLQEAAGRLDATGLAERTITAVDLLGKDDFFANLQKKDTLQLLAGVNIRKRLPFQPGVKKPSLILLLLLLCVVGAFLPTASKERAGQQHQLLEKVKEEEQKLKDEEEKLVGQQLDAEELAAYEKLLEEIRQELSGVETEEELKKTAERAALKLADLRAENQRKTAEKLSRMAEEAEGLLQKAMDSLAEADDLSEMTEGEREKLKELLDQLQQSETLTEEEKSNLAKTALAAQAGNANASQLAAAAASVGMLQDAAASQLAQNTGGDSADPNNSDPNNSDPNSSDPGTGDPGNSGDPANGDQNNGGGQNSGGQSGGQSGGGNGHGGGMNYGSNVGSEEEAVFDGDMIAIPNESGDDANLTGTKGEGDSYQVTGGEALTWSGEAVQYDKVIGSYREAAMAQLKKADYPAGVQDLIRAYFNDIGEN